jgi:hypothetical protein
MVNLTAEEVDILLAAKALLSNPDNCLFGAQACTDLGVRVKPMDPRATHWCFIGAIAKYSPGGFIPYPILRHLDHHFIEFEPVLSQDWCFEVVYDQAFSHSRILEFFDFLLANVTQRSPDPETGPV